MHVSAHVVSSHDAVQQASDGRVTPANDEKVGPPPHEALTQNDGESNSNRDSDRNCYAHNERKLKGFSWFIVVVAILAPTFLYALDNTIMANVRPSIIDTFDRVDMLTWLSVSYPMGEVGANPLWFVFPTFLAICTDLTDHPIIV